MLSSLNIFTAQFTSSLSATTVHLVKKLLTKVGLWVIESQKDTDCTNHMEYQSLSEPSHSLIPRTHADIYLPTIYTEAQCRAGMGAILLPGYASFYSGVRGSASRQPNHTQDIYAAVSHDRSVYESTDLSICLGCTPWLSPNYFQRSIHMSRRLSFHG